MLSFHLHTTYWYMFPVAIAVATVAMLTGVGGSKFFSPIFILLLRLDPQVAFGVALFTQSFGFLSGLVAYGTRQAIDYRMGIKVLLITLPVSLLAVYVSDLIPPVRLEQIFAIILIGLSLLVLGKHSARQSGEEGPSGAKLGGVGMAVSALGAAFIGLISVGLGELLTPFFLIRQRYSYTHTVGTVVFIVFFTTLITALARMGAMLLSGDQLLLQRVFDIVVFTVPGVLIGGQLAPSLSMKASAKTMERFLQFTFAAVGAVMLASSLGR